MHARLAKYEQAHGGSSLEFLRTHPGGERRIKVSCSVSTISFKFSILRQHLQELVPEAYSVQASSPQCAGIQDSVGGFKEFAARWT
jgi:metalloendopeptidase OMA1, mitochondrial